MIGADQASQKKGKENQNYAGYEKDQNRAVVTGHDLSPQACDKFHNCRLKYSIRKRSQSKSQALFPKFNSLSHRKLNIFHKVILILISIHLRKITLHVFYTITADFNP
jgi:hypothetical protein